MNPKAAPYGSWQSPITSDWIVKQTTGLGAIQAVGDSLYWIEARPQEGGRNAIVCQDPDGSIRDVIPAKFNARTRVHEYGGGSYIATKDGIFFANFSDQRLYFQGNAEAQPKALTSELPQRYADMVLDERRMNLIAVREDHSPENKEPINTIVSISLEGPNEGRILTSGYDFYANPRLSPNGTKLLWICWNHPNMPWDTAELWVADVGEDGQLGKMEKIAGGESESVVQPEWSSDGSIVFIADRSGWWNLYQWRDGSMDCLCEKNADFGNPQWVFRTRTFALVDNKTLYCSYKEKGDRRLAKLCLQDKTLSPIEMPYNALQDLQFTERGLVVLAGSPSTETELALYQAEEKWVTIKKPSTEVFPTNFLSSGQFIEFPTINDRTAFAYYYPPTNKNFEGTAGELPPLLVKSHGGPTGHTNNTLSRATQYWTSRGFAVVDVDYGGSTGYGRAYRESLYGTWGIVDIEDCIHAAKYLIDKGLADKNRVAIRGGSAGGYTTLCGLTFHDFFKAGACYYGVSDLEALATDTHKFESRYLDKLIGPFPERKDLYEARSPIKHAERLQCPTIFFQGLEDKICPPNQAELMVDILKKKGIPVAYLPIEGEQHGFRKAENIKRTLDTELYFYGKVFGFEPAGEPSPIQIDNLPKGG